MRHQWVFRESCGCPFGVLEDGGHTPAEAWQDFYDVGSKAKTERAIGQAVARGITVVKVDMDRYTAELYPLMRQAHCPHGRAS